MSYYLNYRSFWLCSVGHEGPACRVGWAPYTARRGVNPTLNQPSRKTHLFPFSSSPFVFAFRIESDSSL